MNHKIISIDSIPYINDVLYKIFFNSLIKSSASILNNECNQISRGFCIVFNMIDYQENKLPSRDDAREYVWRIKDIFEQLNFRVEVYENYYYENMKEEIMDIINSEECNDDDAIVLYIGTHGNEDGFYCSDTKLVKHQEIIDMFSNKNCLKFANKPKLIFFDFCRGGIMY